MADKEDPSVPSLADRLRDALAAVPAGAAGRGPSALREQVRAVFDRLTADRERGATWDGLAAPFAALGVATAAGTPPTGADLRNAYHAERYARGGKRRRRSKRGPEVRRTAVEAAPAEAPTAPTPAAPVAPAAVPEPPPGAEGLRAALAKRRPDLREPAPINLGPEDRRPRQERNEDG